MKAQQELFFVILKTEEDLPQLRINEMKPFEYDKYLTNPTYQKLELPMVIQA